jgi:hypothetical protein
MSLEPQDGQSRAMLGRSEKARKYTAEVCRRQEAHQAVRCRQRASFHRRGTASPFWISVKMFCLARHNDRSWSSALATTRKRRAMVVYRFSSRVVPTGDPVNRHLAHARATIPPPMPLQVLQRPHWHGTPLQLRELFVLHKNRREAKAILLTHQFGWEARSS